MRERKLAKRGEGGPEGLEQKKKLNSWQASKQAVVWEIIRKDNMKNKTIKIIVQGGVVVDVKNIPDGYEVQIVDKNTEGHDS